MIPATGIPSFPPVFGIWMSDGNQLPPAGETACPTYVAKRLIQQGGAGGFACRSNGHNQWSASKDEQIPENGLKHPPYSTNSCFLVQSPAMALTPGVRLGPYEIVAPLGAGGMG